MSDTESTTEEQSTVDTRNQPVPWEKLKTPAITPLPEAGPATFPNSIPLGKIRIPEFAGRKEELCYRRQKNRLQLLTKFSNIAGGVEKSSSSADTIRLTNPFYPTNTISSSNAHVGMHSQIETFSGSKAEDAKLFLKTIRLRYLGVRFSEDPQEQKSELEDALCTTLVTHTSGEARKWIRSLEDDVTEDWTKLSEAFLRRFPKAERKDGRKNALRDMVNMKQGNMKLSEYFEKARDISRHLPEDFSEEVADAMIGGLNNEIIKGVVGGAMGITKLALEDAIEMVRGAAREQDDQRTWEDEEDLIQAPPKDRSLIKYLEAQEARERSSNQVMQALAEQLKGFSITNANGTYRNTTPYQRGVGGNQGYQGTANGTRRVNPVTAGGNAGSYKGGLNTTCFRCGEKGHIVTYCPSTTPLPGPDQERLRREFAGRAQNRITGQTTSSQEDANNEARARATEAATIEALCLDYEAGNQQLDAWTEGDRHMFIQESFATEILETCYTQNAETYPVQKRSSGDAGITEQPTSRKMAENPTQGGKKTTAKKLQDANPPRDIIGMAGRQNFDIVKALGDQTVSIGILQLLNIAPRVKAQLSSAMRLPPKAEDPVRAANRAPPSAPNKKLRPLTGSATRTRSQTAPDTDRERSGALYVGANREILAADVIPQLNKSPVFNFYTRSTIQPQKNSQKYDLVKTLLDGGSVLNLIPQRVVTQTNLTEIPDSSISIKCATGEVQRLRSFVRFAVSVAGVTTVIEAYVVPGDTSYSLLLGRQWLRSVKAIGDYSNDSYWIQDEFGTQRKVKGISPPKPVQIPEVAFNAAAMERDVPFDGDTLADLEATQHALGDAILEEIIRDAHRDIEESEEESEEEGEEDPTQEWSEKDVRS